MNIDTPEGMDQAKEWLERWVAWIKPGGSWAIPRAATIYEIDNRFKIAKRVLGPGDGPTERVFAEIGWVVKKGETA